MNYFVKSVQIVQIILNNYKDLKNKPISEVSFCQTSKRSSCCKYKLFQEYGTITSHTPDHPLQFWNHIHHEKKNPIGEVAHFHQFALGNYKWPLYTTLKHQKSMFFQQSASRRKSHSSHVGMSNFFRIGCTASR